MARRPACSPLCSACTGTLALVERSIDFHRDHLARLIQPARQIGRHEVSHLLDGARRLAEAVAVRDVQAKSLDAVLQSLVRVPAPAPFRFRDQLLKSETGHGGRPSASITVWWRPGPATGGAL